MKNPRACRSGHSGRGSWGQYKRGDSTRFGNQRLMLRIYPQFKRACCAIVILAGLLLWPTLSSATIAFVATGSADSGTTASTTASIARPAGTAVGNLFVVQLAVRAAATTITAPTGWTKLPSARTRGPTNSSIFARISSNADSSSDRQQGYIASDSW